ncbi:hypothetical protein JCGZ_11501 [Jatropha curcas]|uniref:RNase III domain-containing protein n=1 Tax=Jatropha curcas TaxID=180498 RepID=A0A067KFU2_JATCU|nr:protein NUCLEAR FUSION DEFECTIVE 2 [Jatropha curcas]KDP31125.1 hypothetical protein JCGZ_11501 [Jatropha curcas]
MASRHFNLFFMLLVLPVLFLSQVRSTNENDYQRIKPSSSPFDSALESLQKQINYTFLDVGLLRRAMTHPSFSQENNKVLSILGFNVIETFVSLLFIGEDIDISSKVLNRRLSEISKVETSCAVDGMRLGLHEVVRVSSKTNSTAPLVVCGAFRAIFGAIAIDTGKSDDAGSVFWGIRAGEAGKALAL